MKKQGLGTGGWGLAVLVGLGFAYVLCSVDAFAEVIDGSTEADLRVTLKVFDYAQVELGDLAHAKEEATRILRGAGVETAWLECVLTAEGPYEGKACSGQLASGKLVLRILPRAMAERMPFTGDTFGFAQQSTEGQPAYVASVFYHRVERLADNLGFSRGAILGHALAHEIGHLLLGPDRHAPSGIMRASWKQKDLLAASMGNLHFSTQQASLIRAEVERRMHLHEGPQLQVIATRQ